MSENADEEKDLSVGWLSWKPTSDALLEWAEKRMLQGVRRTFKSYFVRTRNRNNIRTLEMGTLSSRLPLVIIHGFGAGVGFWVMNLDSISKNQNVYAFDLPGFGRSTRPDFPYDGDKAEKYFVETIEQWRDKVGLEKFILLGHSFGAYLACSYSLLHPDRVKHLILADPWGMPEKPDPGEVNFDVPRWAKVVAAILSPFNPLAILRVAGPFGPSLISRFRPDLKRKFQVVFGEDDDRVTDYVYHLNAQHPSGEMAFKSLSIPYGWAKYPMVHRIKDIDAEIPLTILYGSRTWMESTAGYSVKYIRQDSKVDVVLIKGAGHHIYADKPLDFNDAINSICDSEAQDGIPPSEDGIPLNENDESPNKEDI